MPLTETIIRNLTTAQSFARGEDYYHSGAVYELQKRGNTIIAEVEGSSYEPYQVTIELTEDEIISTYCTCPYDWGGDCKHIVAVLLTYLHQSDPITERPPAEELLANLGEAELRELLTALLNSEPHLIEWVETKLAVQSTTKTAPTKVAEEDVIHLSPQHPTPIDPTPFRRQARQILRSPGGWDYYGAAWDVASQMSELLNQVMPFLEANDGNNALLVLEAMVEPYINTWYDYDDSDGELGAVFGEIGPLFTEALLSTDLSSDERRAWTDKLTVWQGEISDYGIDEAFDAAIAAAEQGWDYPPLQKVLQGQITNKGAWEDEAPWYADDLAVARLNVLERQGRTTEYLYLAEAEGQTALYLTMLVKVERSEEAVEYGMKYMATTDEALALAQALRGHNQPLEALKIAEYGLSLEGAVQTLACWLRDFATEMNQPEIALKAAQVAFANSFSLENYQAAEAVAGEKWPAVKAELLDQLAGANYAYSRIGIYLYEGMVDEAIKTLDKQSYIGYYELEPVVEAAWQSHPDWVIRQCKKQAESIMDSGKSKYYHHAIRWLEKTRRAYLGADRAEEWLTYLEGLISKHTRKYSLRPQLEGLRD